MHISHFALAITVDIYLQYCRAEWRSRDSPQASAVALPASAVGHYGMTPFWNAAPDAATVAPSS